MYRRQEKLLSLTRMTCGTKTKMPEELFPERGVELLFLDDYVRVYTCVCLCMYACVCVGECTHVCVCVFM